MESTHIPTRTDFEENARRYVEDVRNGERYDLIPELTAEECTLMDDPDTVVTHEMQEDMLRRFRAAFPDKHETIDDLWFDEKAGVGVIHYTMTGTFENDLVLKPGGETELTFAPAGEEFSYSGVYIGRFEGDRVVEMGGYADELSWFVDLGIVPELEELAA